MSAYSLMSDDYLITTAYARDVLTDLEAELLKRLERAVDAACGVERPEQRITMEEYRMYDDPLARLRSEAEQRARGHIADVTGLAPAKEVNHE